MVNNYDVAVLSEKVAYLEAAIKNAGIELPEVTSADNGKTLQVVNGAWATGGLIPDSVTANPTGEITNNLTALQIGSTKYNVDLPITTYTSGNLILNVKGDLCDLYYIANDSEGISIGGIELPGGIKPLSHVYFTGKGGDAWTQAYKINAETGVLNGINATNTANVAVQWPIFHVSFMKA